MIIEFTMNRSILQISYEDHFLINRLSKVNPFKRFTNSAPHFLRAKLSKSTTWIFFQKFKIKNFAIYFSFYFEKYILKSLKLQNIFLYQFPQKRNLLLIKKFVYFVFQNTKNILKKTRTVIKLFLQREYLGNK